MRETMKLGIFTDAHYSSREVTCGVRKNSLSLEKIREACRFFEREGCSLAVCLGDLTDAEDDHEKERENLQKIGEVLRSSRVETLCLMGNHDAFAFTREEFYAVLGEGTRPTDRVIVGRRLVFLDACFYRSGAPYLPGGTDWTDSFLPFEASLARTLERAEEDVYVFLHQNLDPGIAARYRPSNAESVNALLTGSKKVKAVFQGHYHPGHRSVWDGVRYITFPAMCEHDGAYFIEEI